MTNDNCSMIVSFDDAHKAKARKLLTDTRCRLPSQREWADMLPVVRAAYRSIKLEEFGSFADLSRDDAATFLDQLGMTADYMEAIAIVCNAACAIFTKALTAPGAPLATV